MRWRLAILFGGDLIALLLFVLVGQVDHSTLDRTNPIAGALPTFLPLASAWMAVAWLLRARPGTPFRLWPFLGRSVIAWLIAAPIGLVLRMFWLGRGSIPGVFILVALATGGLFLLGWRLVYGLIYARRSSPIHEGPSTEP